MVRARRRWLALAVVVLVLLAGGAAYQLERPLPRAQLLGMPSASWSAPGSPPTLAWPGSGQASLYLQGWGWLGSSPDQRSVPIASVTKVMTALVTLRSHPLEVGAAGPEIPVSAADVTLYQQERAAGDSVVAVAAGQPLSEEQALQGLLIASGDNLAALLANWVAGSQAAFVARMNQAASGLGLTQTRFADPSGLDPQSVSTARDLVLLARAALELPAFAAVVRQSSVPLPLGGAQPNYNPILGQAGVSGVKTGWTEQAQGCLLFSALSRLRGHAVTILGAVLGQPGGPSSGLQAAGQAALRLLAEARPRLRLLRLPPAGVGLGRLRAAWSSGSALRADGRTEVVVPGGALLRLQLLSHPGKPPWRRSEVVARLRFSGPLGTLATVDLSPVKAVPGPTWWWRLLHF